MVQISVFFHRVKQTFSILHLFHKCNLKSKWWECSIYCAKCPLAVGYTPNESWCAEDRTTRSFLSRCLNSARWQQLFTGCIGSLFAQQEEEQTNTLCIFNKIERKMEQVTVYRQDYTCTFSASNGMLHSSGNSMFKVTQF